MTRARIIVYRQECQDYTWGELMIVDGSSGETVFRCYTLEDPVRTFKIPGKTAIPYKHRSNPSCYRDYRVTRRFEGGFHNRYKRRWTWHDRGMLEIKDVDGFTHVLFHCGNTVKSTRGCILLGNKIELPSLTEPGATARLIQSAEAYRGFYEALRDFDDITLDIQ